ncbi:MAG: TolC family protein [Bacteroidetes bacterium]|nr:TolC family protein [Bacteroidota bacterium]
MKRIKFIIFTFLISGAVYAQQELVPCLKTASENNAALKASFSEYRAALEMIPQARALPDPEIMFQYFTTPVLLEMGEQRFNISASQFFPWFGKLDAQEQAAALMAKAKYESFIEARNKMFYEIKNVYYKLYVQRKSVQITEANLDLLRSFREIAKIRFESGKNSFVDVLRADMEIAEMENSLAYFRDSELPLKAEFEKLLNQKIPGEIIMPDTLWLEETEIPKSALLDSIAANNPVLKNLDYELSSWEKQMEVAKKMGYPSLSLGLTYMNMARRTDISLQENGRDMYMFPEIGIMIPINRKKYNSMINEARYKSEAVSYEKTNMKNELSAELEMTYRDYLDARRKIKLYTRLHNLAKNARELIMSEYSVAGTSFEEVLRMQEQELKYALMLEDARAMQNSTVANINYLTGKE